MRKDQLDFSPGDCWERRPTCPYDLVELMGVAHFPAGVTWSNGIPDRDLALLPVRIGLAGRTIADVAWTVGDSSQITVAGYGKSNVPDYKPLNGIQVGWHKVSGIDGTALLIPQMSGSADSGICMGDSGSAVLLGMENGLVERRHTLISVVSSITYSGTGAATVGSCMEGVGRAVYVAKFRDWICATTARQIPACLIP